MPVPVLPGTDAPLAAGERVLLTDRKKRRYLVDLEVGGEWHSHGGIVSHDDIIGGSEGRAVRTTKGMEIVVLRPTRSDYVVKMKRGAQVVYPKDQARIIEVADIRPGTTVVEAGAGSGALSMALLDAVGPTGKLISFERRDDHISHARRNVEDQFGGLPDNWDLRDQDLAEGLAEITAHRVVLDLLDPWTHVDAAAQALPPGGILVSYTPSITQVMRFREALIADGRWANMSTTESFVRGWDLDGLAVRPAHRMVAHTAFLTTARRVLPVEDGGPPVRYTAPDRPHVTWHEAEVDPDKPEHVDGRG